MANTFKSLDDVINLFCELHDRYPGIIAIVDGVRSPVSSKPPQSLVWNLCAFFSLPFASGIRGRECTPPPFCVCVWMYVRGDQLFAMSTRCKNNFD